MLGLCIRLSRFPVRRRTLFNFKAFAPACLDDVSFEAMSRTSILHGETGVKNPFTCLQVFDQKNCSAEIGWRIFPSLSFTFLELCFLSYQSRKISEGHCRSWSSLYLNKSCRRLHMDVDWTVAQGTSVLACSSSNLKDDAQLGCNIDPSAQKDGTILKDATTIQKLLKLHGNSGDLEQALENFCFLVTEDLVLEILRRNRSEWKLALSFFNWAACQQGYSHGSRAYNKMLDILGSMKQIKCMRQMFEEIPNMKCDPIVNERTFSILLNRYAASHHVSEAIEIFYKRKEYGLELSMDAFQGLLIALCRYKHVEEAESLFLQKQLEFPPVIKSRNIILNGWCVLGSLREAKRFWNDIVTSGCKPDLYTYGIFINSLTKAGKLATAVNLFTAMWGKGLNPDMTICNCIIDALCFKKKIPEALEVFEEMNERGCLPDVATYNTLIKHICHIRRMEKAYALLDEMEQKGIVPSTRTYAYFLKTMTKHEEVDAMIFRMKRNGCQLDADTYNLILNLYVKWNYQIGVQSVWTEMETNGLGPDQRSYTILIHGLHSEGKLDEAWKYYSELRSKGMIPEPRTRLLMRAIKLTRVGGDGI